MCAQILFTGSSVIIFFLNVWFELRRIIITQPKITPQAQIFSDG